MKRTHLRLIAVTTLLAAVAAGMAGCSTTMHHQTIPDAAYRQALANPAARAAPGSEAERRGIARVKAMFTNYTEENLRRAVRETYAPNLYFRDAFKQFTTAAEIEHYLLEGVKNLRSCTFEFEEPVSGNGEVYLRWVMVVNLKRDPPDRVERSLGMSHMRFDPEGRVIFHQDYWDPTDVIYTRIPIANWLIAKVKAMQ